MTRKHARILDRTTLHRKFLHVFRVSVEHETVSGGRQIVEREVHDHGNAATILLFDPLRRLVVLVKQFRTPVHINGDEGWLIETPAGLLDDDSPEEAIRREAMEETGYHVETVRHLFDAYMSPGAVTERVSFFAAEIDTARKAGLGGGLDSEGEDIEILLVPLDDAFAMMSDGRIRDGKTIMLLQWAQLNLSSTIRTSP